MERFFTFCILGPRAILGHLDTGEGAEATPGDDKSHDTRGHMTKKFNEQFSVFILLCPSSL